MEVALLNISFNKLNIGYVLNEASQDLASQVLPFPFGGFRCARNAAQYLVTARAADLSL